MFTRRQVAASFAFRGGTALHKFCLDRPGRYSEDIDLVQIEPGPIGPALDELRAALDPWLGEPSFKSSADGVKLLYRFATTALPSQPMRVKIEINTREHFSCRALREHEFAVDTLWYTGTATVTTYDLNELLATKLRALYQRKKGRDLYDLWRALTDLDVDTEAVVSCFQAYMDRSSVAVTRAMYEANLAEKLASRVFRNDVVPLLGSSETYDVGQAGALVRALLVARLPGEPWKGSD